MGKNVYKGSYLNKHTQRHTHTSQLPKLGHWTNLNFQIISDVGTQKHEPSPLGLKVRVFELVFALLKFLTTGVAIKQDILT